MKKICVYCGSNFGKNSEYIDSAKVLAKELIDRNIDLVYGGANVGIMEKMLIVGLIAIYL